MELPYCTEAAYQLHKLMSNKKYRYWINQDTFMFREYKTRENIRQNNVKFMIIKQYIYRNRCFKSNLSILVVLYEIKSYI